MKITREQLRNIVGEVLQEEKDYQSFFKAMLKKHGVSSPDEFKSDEEKKAFFNKVEDTWKGVSERLQTLKEDELTAKQQKIDLNKNGKVDGDDLSKLRAGTKTEGELSAAQQKIDLNKNGKVDGDDLSKLRAGAKTEGEQHLPQTKILSKEGETLVKSGAGNMYNISKVNEAFPTKKVDAKVIADRMRNHKETKGFADKIEKLKMVSAEDLDKMLPDYVDGGVITKIFKESVNEAKYPTSLYVNSIIYGQGFTGLKGIEGGKYYKVVEMDDTTATLAPCDQKGKITGSKKVRHKLDSIEGGIKTAKRGDENGIVVESVNFYSEPLKLKGIKINKKSDVTFVLEVSFLIGDEVVMSYLTTGTSQDAQKLKSKVEKAFNAGKIVSPSGIGYYAYNESVINN